jgi:transcriptional regulator with XRE-family HTH domain
VISRLKSTREGAGLSLAQAAKLLGWANGPLHAMEIGAGAPPTDDDLRALAALYRCSVAWLRGETAELSAENVALLRTCENTGDRETLRNFMLMISTRDPGEPAPPSAQERLAKVAAKHEPVTSLSAKRRHVARESRKAPTRAHHCHWTGCTKTVPPAMWGCLEHWRRLPKVLRDRIWAAYQPGQEIDMSPSSTYLQVADDVQRWIADQAMERGKR